MQKRAVETRNKILAAAVELFAAGGMKGTGVDLIAASAGVNKQRIYAYFGSKEKLFIAALTSVFKAAEPFSLSMLEEAEKHPEKLTSILLENFLKLHESNPCFWRLLAWANLENAGLLENLSRVRSAENNGIRKIFIRAQKEGFIKDVAFEHYLFSLLAVSWFLKSNALTLRSTLDFDPCSEEFSSGLFAALNGVFSR